MYTYANGNNNVYEVLPYSLPVLHSSIKVRYKNFESFTAVDETKNIAVWAANAMKYLSTSLEPRLSLEVGVNISTRDRGRSIRYFCFKYY